LIEDGMTIDEIARQVGDSVEVVHRWIRAYKRSQQSDRPPKMKRLVPRFPAGLFRPADCLHKPETCPLCRVRPIPEGIGECCMLCHRSGYDPWLPTVQTTSKDPPKHAVFQPRCRTKYRCRLY
jgi:hypothetical protein